MTSSGDGHDGRAHVDRFVAARAAEVAGRAAEELDRLLLETSRRPLVDVPDGLRVVHRLIGTLGTYGFTEAAARLRSAEQAAGSGARDGEVPGLLAAARSALADPSPLAPSVPNGLPAPPPSGRPLRVLLVEDDDDVAAWTGALLRERLGARTERVPGAAAAARAAGADVDVVVADLELAEGDGLSLTAELTARHPGLPVVVVSSHASFDTAVVALRAGAVDFLAKPADPQRLVAAVQAAGAARRSRRRTRVLAVGAHPDDVELGLGATLAKHVSAGHEVTVAVCSHGEAGGAQRAGEARAAAELLGVRLVLGTLPDTAIEDGAPTVRFLDDVCRDLAPDAVYLHSAQDTHQDHRAVHRAGLVAARSVPLVACYQSPSATVAYRPSRFEDVTGHLPAKLAAIAAHRSQAGRAYVDPELVTATARYWGRFGRVRYAEPLELVRDVAPARVGSSEAGVAGQPPVPDPFHEPGAEP